MRGQVESIQDPEWWDQDTVVDVVDHVCEKAGRNSGMAAIFKGNKKQPIMAKVSMRHLNEMIREKNAFAREVNEAWQDYVHLKTRMDSEVAKVTKRNNFLVEELENWKQQVHLSKYLADNSSKNSKRSLRNLRRKHKNSSRRSKRTNARPTVLQCSSTNKKSTQPTSKNVWTAQNDNATTPSKPSPWPKNSQNNSKATAPNSRQSSKACATQTNIRYLNVTRRSKSYCIC